MTQSFREPTPAERRSDVRAMVVYVLSTSIAAGVLASVRFPSGLVVWVVLVLTSTTLLVHRNARRSGYRCLHCGYEFQVTTWTELISFQGMGGGGWKYLRCPRCDLKSRAKALVAVR